MDPRPSSITIVSWLWLYTWSVLLFNFFGMVGDVMIATYPDTVLRRLGPALLIHMGITLLVTGLCLTGFWTMKRWSVVTYLFFSICSFTYLATSFRVVTNDIALTALVLIVGLINYNKME